MKNKIVAYFSSTLFVSFCALANSEITGAEVLAVEKGGTPDKVYTTKKPALTIATYNIGKNETGNDVKDFVSLNQAMKNIDADIIAVTEIDNKTVRSGRIDQLATIAKSNHLYFVFGKALDFDGGEYGVGILSRFKIEKSQTIKLPSGQAEQRVVLLSQIRVPDFDAPIIVMTTHLDWQKDPTVRLRQLRHLLDVSIGDVPSDFKNIASSIKILAGDFNSTGNEQTIKEISYFFNTVQKAGVDNRTWPAVNPALDIDHIFTFRGQVWNVDKLVIPRDSDTFRWSAVSDHLPVIARLELAEQ